MLFAETPGQCFAIYRNSPPPLRFPTVSWERSLTGDSWEVCTNEWIYRWLWRRSVILHRVHLEDHGGRGVRLPGALRDGWRRALEMERLSLSIYGSPVKGTKREGCFTGKPEGYFRLVWPCIINVGWRERNQQDATNLMFIIKHLSHHVSGIIMPIIRRTRVWTATYRVCPKSHEIYIF